MNSEAKETEKGSRPKGRRPPRAASRVALGIGCSRAFGFLREVVLAYFFGAGPHADVFRTALRGPNLLQNLLGEQTLSASFIPVYSRLLASGRPEAAGRFAGAVFGLLLAVAAGVSLVGVWLAEPIVSLLAPGYLADAGKVAAGELSIDRYPLAVSAVRIIFPMTGILVLSAWALGVLNSHRRFFISYMAPALWNAAIIGALILGAAKLTDSSAAVDGLVTDPQALNQLVIAACWGALAGGVLQFAVQLPWALGLLRGFRPSLSVRISGVREALRAFAPLLAGRGAVQISGYLDFFLASFLAAGAVAALGWAQTLYLLPISLFGMSVAAAELPELARQVGVDSADAMMTRVRSSFRQMAFLTIPSAVGFLVFGYLIIGALFRRGEFGESDNWLVYLVLVGYSLGLVASTSSRLLNNVYYALGKTRIPARIAVERVLLSAAVGVVLMFWLDRTSVNQLFGYEESGNPLFLGAVGLAVGAGISSWYELLRLHRALVSMAGPVLLPWGRSLKVLAMALCACVPGLGLWYVLRYQPVLLLAPVVLMGFGSTYFVLTKSAGLAEFGAWLGESKKDER